MKCGRCGSFRMMKFVDGFGQRRIFCRGCWGSFLDASVISQEQTRLPNFYTSYYNKKALIRHFSRRG